MDLVVSEAGRRYLERIPSEEDAMEKRWDEAILRYIDEGHLEGSDLNTVEHRLGYAGKKIIRRLFEEGYLEYEDC